MTHSRTYKKANIIVLFDEIFLRADYCALNIQFWKNYPEKPIFSNTLFNAHVVAHGRKLIFALL
jgi:heme/copper-type cytochrome/quinol oxidase subunit 1